jgi:tRNA 2-thiouridine synthesizing protein A
MATVDARGYSCPVPLLMVQEEIKKTDPAQLEVLIDAPCAVENIQRFAYHNGYAFQAEENGDEWTLKLSKK